MPSTPTRFRALLLSATLALSAVAAHSQSSLLNNAGSFTPIQITPQVHEELGALTTLSNQIFKPSGAGPFPAVVLVHTCGGLKNPHMRLHTQDCCATVTRFWCKTAMARAVLKPASKRICHLSWV